MEKKQSGQSSHREDFWQDGRGWLREQPNPWAELPMPKPSSITPSILSILAGIVGGAVVTALFFIWLMG